MAMAFVDGKISLAALLRNWGAVYLSNLIGALALGFAFSLSGLLAAPFGATAARSAEAKAAFGPTEGLVRGALCTALVCLAVWLGFAARSTTDRILAILWPLSCFVLLGLEHSVANMYLLPAGLLAVADIGVVAVLGILFRVSLGKIVSGAGGVALAYRYAYLSRSAG